MTGISGEAGGPAIGQPRPLMILATWLTAMLTAFVIATLTGFAVSAFDVVGLLLFFAIMPVFLVWLYRASGNAHASGCPQRRSAAGTSHRDPMAGGGMVGVLAARVGDRRPGREKGRIHPRQRALYSTSGSRLTLAVTAILLILIVRTVSGRPLGDGQTRR